MIFTAIKYIKTRTAFKLCSPYHLQSALDHLELTFFSNGYPLQKIRELMQHTLKNSNGVTPSKPDSNHLTVSIPYDARHSSSMRKVLSRYNIGTVFYSTNTLRSLLTHTNTPTPAKPQKNVIYKIPCSDCDAYYIGQTCRSLLKRIKEHKACHGLNNIVDSSTGNMKSAPAKHRRGVGHRMDWESTTVVASCNHRSQLDLLEHAAIITMDPSMNLQHQGPRVNACWQLLLETIVTSFVNKPAKLEIGN